MIALALKRTMPETIDLTLSSSDEDVAQVRAPVLKRRKQSAKISSSSVARSTRARQPPPTDHLYARTDHPPEEIGAKQTLVNETPKPIVVLDEKTDDELTEEDDPSHKMAVNKVVKKAVVPKMKRRLQPGHNDDEEYVPDAASIISFASPIHSENPSFLEDEDDELTEEDLEIVPRAKRKALPTVVTSIASINLVDDDEGSSSSTNKARSSSTNKARSSSTNKARSSSTKKARSASTKKTRSSSTKKALYTEKVASSKASSKSTSNDSRSSSKPSSSSTKPFWFFL